MFCQGPKWASTQFLIEQTCSIPASLFSEHLKKTTVSLLRDHGLWPASHLPKGAYHDQSGAEPFIVYFSSTSRCDAVDAIDFCLDDKQPAWTCPSGDRMIKRMVLSWERYVPRWRLDASRRRREIDDVHQSCVPRTTDVLMTFDKIGRNNTASTG